jgi:hypothetical protein
MKMGTALGVACIAMLVVPAPAWAAPEFDAPATLSTVTGIMTLLLALGMLLVVVELRRVAAGSAIARKISYVVAGALCLAASVLAGFVDRFVASWLSVDEVRAGADLLVLLSMGFFVLYFNAVRGSLVSFLDGLNAEEAADVSAERELLEANGEVVDG